MEHRDLNTLPSGWCAYPHTTTGYRVNLSFSAATRSIFYTNHNEFWMIWTDLLPLCVFVALFAIHWHQTGGKISLASGVHAGVVLSRLCSCTYHVYNCCSLRANQRLIYLDLIGICCMAFGSPWLFAVANGTNNPVFHVYIAILAIQYACCVGLFARLLLSNANMTRWTPWHQPLLVGLAATGNFPALQIHHTPLARLAVAFFVGGYLFFYTLKLPECLFPHIAFDGRIWNSHVLWHLAAAGAQLCFVVMTF